MNSFRQAENLVLDLVDNWRDEWMAKYIARKLLLLLQLDKNSVLEVLGNRTIILNLLDVIFCAILKYNFRIQFLGVLKLLMCASHPNTMFMFEQITSNKGHYIYDILHISLATNDITLLAAITGIRAKAGKHPKFRIDYDNINKTGYAKLAHDKIVLYRHYFSRLNLNEKICILVLKDLFGSISGQPALKHTFCKCNGIKRLLSVFDKICLNVSEKSAFACSALCNVIGTLLETDKCYGSMVVDSDVKNVVENIIRVIKKYKNNTAVIEVALPVLSKSMKLLTESSEKMTTNTVSVAFVENVKSIHSGNLTVYQNCAILKMIIENGMERVGGGEGPKKRVGSRCSRSKTQTKASSKRSRANAAKDKTVMPPSSIRGGNNKNR